MPQSCHNIIGAIGKYRVTLIDGDSDMTQKQAFYAIRAWGMAVQYNNGEWQVDYRKTDWRRTSTSRYFTNDLNDAVATSKVMAKFDNAHFSEN